MRSARRIPVGALVALAPQHLREHHRARDGYNVQAMDMDHRTSLCPFVRV
jgi:hypothetical protein